MKARLADWRAVLTGAADQAQAALDDLRGSDWGKDVGWGADGTMTAAADVTAETAALEYLADCVPQATICSEEAGVREGTGDVLLIVDPLDGTNNAVHGIPYWAFAVAVLIDGEPRGALVRNVPSRCDFFAWAGEGAYVGARRCAAADVTSLGDATILLQRPAEPEAFERARLLMAGTALCRILGAAALDICAVGAGRIHAYANPNTNLLFPFGEKVVDYAAAAVFVSAAGGVVTSADGSELSFEPDLSVRVPIAAACTPKLHGRLLSALADGNPEGATVEAG